MSMSTQRAYPGIFLGKDTYGVSSQSNSDRLPVVSPNAKGDLDLILVGPYAAPTRMCLALLKHAEESDDVLRLVIGAMLDSSHTSPTAAKVHSTAPTGYAAAFRSWYKAVVFPTEEPVVTREVPEQADDNENDKKPVTNPTSTGTEIEPPYDSLPDWAADIDGDREDLLFSWSVDEMEAAFYAGVLAFAIGKQPTADNIEAYNSRRRNAVSQYLTGGVPKIFVDDSPYLSLEVLSKVHRVFNPSVVNRALALGAIVDNDSDLVSNRYRGFYTMFRLSQGASLNPLLIITKFARKYPSYYKHFKDLTTEYQAAAKALERFYDAPEKRRLYLKVIFGSAYVPVNRNDVNGLLGIASFALSQNEPTLENYAGGTLSAAHRAKILELLGQSEEQEEVVPEEEVE